MIIDFSKKLTNEEELFVIEQYHKILKEPYVIPSETLQEYEHRIGMKRLIDTHKELCRNSRGTKGKQWMALSPHFSDTPIKDSQYRIRYWVNYGDDETYGWFTVEQIREWLETPNLKLYKLGGHRERVKEAANGDATSYTATNSK